VSKFKVGEKVKLNPNTNYSKTSINRDNISFDTLYTIEFVKGFPSYFYGLRESGYVYSECYLRKVNE